MTRLRVRVSPGFFDQVDHQLGPDRGPHGEPSATDFIQLELPVIIDRFARSFADLPEVIEGVPSTRMLILPGIIVRAVAVFGTLADDEVVELIGLTIDP